MTSWWARWRLKSPASPLFTQPSSRLRDLMIRRLMQYWNTLQWRHDGRDSVSNHQLRHCLLNRLSSPVTGEFPAQMASNAENVPIWWRHHELFLLLVWLVYQCTLVTPSVRRVHDDVIKWEHFPRYWPFVRGIHVFNIIRLSYGFNFFSKWTFVIFLIFC